MPSTEVLLAFVTASAVFAYMPGPAMLYAAGRTLAGGRSAGFMATGGIHLGGYVHVIAAALGLSLLFEAVPWLYALVKLGGAAYLIWLGVGLLRAVPAEESDAPMVGPAALPVRRAFLQSMAVEVLNPKTALFFLAFLPQFVDPAGSLPVWAQFLLLGTVVNCLFSSADILCVFLAGRVMDLLRQSAAGRRTVQRLGGGILIGLGVHLAAGPAA